MKSLIILISCLLLLSGISSVASAEEAKTKVYLDGKELAFDQNPVIENGRVMVPLRKIFESLKASVKWDQETQTVISVKNTTTIKITAGSSIAFINDAPVNLDQPPIIINGRTLVPVRFVSEALDAKVQWNSEKQSVSVYSNEKGADIITAEEYFRKGNVESDINTKLVLYNKAIELNPYFVEAYNTRGHIFDQKKLYDQAIADYSKAIELNPQFDKAYNNRGLIYQNKGDYYKALSDFDKAIELNPKASISYRNRGRYWYQKKEFNKAFNDFNKAIEIEPESSVNYYFRGLVYESLGDIEKAKVDYATSCSMGHKPACDKLNRINSR